MSDAFNRAWARTAAAEGGYSNHPDDPGGETNHGITARVARAHGYTGPMRELGAELAIAIAKAEYWDAIDGDAIAAISEPIALELFDTNFNLWYGAAGKFLQRALNGLNRRGRDYPDLDVDGRIGSGTLHALERLLTLRGAAGELVMLRLLNSQQAVDYLRQAAESSGKEEFLFGWILQRVAIDRAAPG